MREIKFTKEVDKILRCILSSKTTDQLKSCHNMIEFYHKKDSIDHAFLLGNLFCKAEELKNQIKNSLIQKDNEKTDHSNLISRNSYYEQ